MLYSGTDPESYITEHTVEHEDKADALGLQGAGCRVQVAGSRFQISVFTIRGSGCGMEGAGCRVPGAG